MREQIRSTIIGWAGLGLSMLGSSAVLAQETLQGTFISANTGSEPIDQAIEAGVAKMNFIKRPIARSRLKKTNPLYQRIEIRQDGARISVRYDEGKPIVMPLDGSAVQWTRDDGEIFDVSARAGATQLQQTFKADDGQRVNEFSLAPDGALTLQVTLTSPQLPAPVTYTLSYRRSG
jgi:hypothetical protein